MAKRDIIISLVTRGDKKGLDDVEKGLDSLGKKADSSGGLFSKLSQKLSSFGDNIGKDLTGKLGPAGGALDDVAGGLGEMAGKAALAGGAVVGLAGLVAGGVGKLKELYDQTRSFNEVAGTTWEEGSKLIAVFDDLRVSSDEGASAMGKLTKTVGTSPQVLAQFGIEIAHAKDGTVDMLGTLENVATAFAATTDPAKRAALGAALFGKSWQNIVPVLQKGGTELSKLVDGVDKSQIATSKGAAEQDKLFKATDDLHDAMAGLQMALAQDIIPALAELAKGGTTAVTAFGELRDKVSKLGPSYEEANKHHIDLKQSIIDTANKIADFGTAADHVGEKTGGFSKKIDQAAASIRTMASGLVEQAGGLVNTEARIKDATKAYDAFKKKVDDLLKQQEDMRDAQLDQVDTALASEKAQVAAGDASSEVSDKAKIAADAIAQYGADSTEAKTAVEEHRRALLDAKSAMDASGDAAVANAAKIAEGNGTTLTAAEKIAIYRAEMIRLRDGAKDPDLIASLDGLIQHYADLAAQAQNAAANAHGLAQAFNDAAGIERNFTSRDSSGVAVTRRATGGPVWPGRDYLVHQDEVIRLPLGTGPGEVLSPPEAAQLGSGAYPTVTTNADGSVMFGGDPNVYPATVVKTGGTGGVKFPSVNTYPVSSAATLPGYGPTSTATATAGGAAVVYNITFNGITDIPKLIQEIKRVQAGRQ